MRRLGDRRDVVPVSRAVREGRAADERRALVDRLGEPLGRDRTVPPGRTCTTSAPRSSCACAIWPTVGNSYSLITIRFRSPSSRSAESSALDALRDRGRDRDVVGRRMQQPCDRRSERLVPLDPVVPLGAVRVPAREPLLDRCAHPVGERALRAGVEVRRRLEDRELAADRGADPSRLNGQGTPSGALRPRGGLPRCPRARSCRSKGRSRDRRSRARRSRSARRPASRRRSR